MSRLEQRVFGFTHESRFFLYEPLSGIAIEVNASAYEEFERLESNIADKTHNEENPFFNKLKEAGLYTKKAAGLPKTRRIPFEPTAVSLLMTQKCNLRCVYCYADGGEGKNVLNFSVAKGAIDLLGDNCHKNDKRAMSISFHGGGEATLEMDLVKRCTEYARKVARCVNASVSFDIGTNGITTAADATWIGLNLHSATLSIDGDKTRHDLTRPMRNGESSYDRTIATAHIWDRLEFSYSVRATITDSTVMHMGQMVESLCFETSAKTIKMEPVFFQGRAVGTGIAPPQPEAFVREFISAEEIASYHGRKLTYSGLRTNVTTDRFCNAVGRSFCVTPTGDVTSCYEVITPGDARSYLFYYGKWDPEKKRFQIDENRQDLQYKLTVDNYPECSKCFCKWHCAGDCPAKSEVNEGKRAPNKQRCQITRALTSRAIVSMLDQIATASE
ncbi:MAG: SPASM domain-containing protein [Deltaproteobacteria bacterium]|nr:SPASM domain-containing protein [Deltaproteobacteria bacterium]